MSAAVSLDISSDPPVLRLQDVHVSYGDRAVVRGLTLQLQRGSIACLLGPSGCGKTTVLRAIAGFEAVQAGSILLKERCVSSGGGVQVQPEHRRVGMVFQDFALFPHLTVAGNIAFGISSHSRQKREARVTELLAAVGLTASKDRYPHELSGGQQQRVALARALAPEPDLLLLDEPFSNLDVAMRERLGQEVRDIIKRTHTTAVLVTHDQHEAFAIADEIGVMRRGRIEQWAGAHQLYHRPATRFVADFVGKGVFVPGTVQADRRVSIETGVLPPLPGQAADDGLQTGQQVDVLLRPDDVVYDENSPLQAVVENKAFQGADILYTLTLTSGSRLLALVPSHHNHAVGEKIGIRLDVDDVVAFPTQESVNG